LWWQPSGFTWKIIELVGAAFLNLADMLGYWQDGFYRHDVFTKSHHYSEN
jgi:hypothetical protein